MRTSKSERVREEQESGEERVRVETGEREMVEQKNNERGVR
jgi:hypothetical protein